MKVLTLLYHRVNILERDAFRLAVSTDDFYQQMCFVKNSYNIVRFEEDWNSLSEDSVCITFDDGYMDNFKAALPILEELEIPATIFVSTDSMQPNKCLWWDELERLLLEDADYPDYFELKDDLFSCSWETGNMQKRLQLFYTLHALMKDYISTAKREDWLHQLQQWHFSNMLTKEKYQTIGNSETDISLLKNPILTIGSHTIHHDRLSKMTYQEQEKEIIGAKEYLEKLLERNITVFSYPFGGHADYNRDSIEICKKAGIIKAASNFRGVCTSATDLFQIPRLRVAKWDLDEYIKMINECWGK